MYEQVEKPKENKSKTVTNSVSQKRRNVKQGFKFEDNRNTLVAQKQNTLSKKSTIGLGESVIQRQIEKDSSDKKYTLLITDDKFLKESIQVFTYLKSKNILGQFINKEIYIQKAEGAGNKVCHHWSFGGLAGNFGLNIEGIHSAYKGTTDDSEFGPDVPGALNWSNLGNDNGLDGFGDTKYSQIRVYEQMAHSSRLLSDGMWWHKFSQNAFVFAVKGGDNNLVYSGFDQIRVKVINSSVHGSKSKFSYVKKWENPDKKNRYEQTNALLGRKNIDRNLGVLQERAKSAGNKEPVQKVTFGKADRFQETFTTKSGLTGNILSGAGTLVQLGIRSLSDLENWLNSKKGEMNNVAKSHYASVDQQMLDMGIVTNTDDGKRTGLCGITCTAILDWLKTNYPLIWNIAGKHTYVKGEHYALKFNFPDGGCVVVDPTYRQFDKANKYKNKSHIWVGTPNAHPFYG